MDNPFICYRSIILLDHLKIQIIKINLLDKIILLKPRSCVTDKFSLVFIKPHRFLQIKFIAGLFQTVIYLGSPGQVHVVILYNGIS